MASPAPTPPWLARRLADARPRALAALTRYFKDLDEAEEAFQEACLRAIRSWPEKGAPKDAVAWLIFVGRNFGIDERRRRHRLTEMPAGRKKNDRIKAPEAHQLAQL